MTAHTLVIKFKSLKCLLFLHLLVFPRNVSNAKRRLQLWSSELEIHTAGKTCTAALLLSPALLLDNVIPQIENLLVVLEYNMFWRQWGNQLQTAQSTEHQAPFTLTKTQHFYFSSHFSQVELKELILFWCTYKIYFFKILSTDLLKIHFTKIKLFVLFSFELNVKKEKLGNYRVQFY